MLSSGAAGLLTGHSLQSVTSYPQLVDNFSLVVGGHRAPVLAGVCEVGGEDEKVVATSSLLQPVLAAGLVEENKLMSGKLRWF